LPHDAVNICLVSYNIPQTGFVYYRKNVMLLVICLGVLMMVNMGNSLERLQLWGDPDIGFYVDANIGTPPSLVRMTS